MISNFFTIALRNLFKHKVFSFINIFGLAIGIAASLMILQYARYELSYDRFEPNAGRIFRLQQDRYNDGKLSTQWAAGAAGIGPVAKSAAPEIEYFARLRPTGAVVSYKDREFREKDMFFATDDFLSMFSYKAVAGAPTDALKDVGTAVITASTAVSTSATKTPSARSSASTKEITSRSPPSYPTPCPILTLNSISCCPGRPSSSGRVPRSKRPWTGTPF
jgi:putative ABC transport system permease protein